MKVTFCQVSLYRLCGASILQFNDFVIKLKIYEADHGSILLIVIFLPTINPMSKIYQKTEKQETHPLG